MKRLLSVFILQLSLLMVFGQQNVTLTFTGRDANNHYCQLNKVIITNLTKSWQETIFWPDTTLSMQNGTGIEEYAGNTPFILFQNNPNPFNGTTEANLNIVESGELTMQIVDVNGRLIYETSSILSEGNHKFRIQIANAGVYFLTARQNGQTVSIKMVNNGRGTQNLVEYVGEETISYSLTQTKGNSKGNTENPFSFGDQMEYVGYATINGAEIESQRIQQMQGASQTFTLQFDAIQTQLPIVTTLAVTDITDTTASCGGDVIADGGANVIARGVCWSMNQNPTIADEHTIDGSGTGNFTSNLTGLSGSNTYYVRAYATNSEGTAYGSQQQFVTMATLVDGSPCPGTPTVTDVDNNTYATVQIGQQCWMRDNLKTTRYADSTDISLGNSTSSSTAYRYYPNNNSNYVSTYGYLYNWKAIMGNSSSSAANPSNVQGICPNGWHVPSDAEWTQLTDYVMSKPEYICDGCSLVETNLTIYCIGKALAGDINWTYSEYLCDIGNPSSDNNATGFNAIPAGNEDTSMSPQFNKRAYFWSCTLNNNNRAYSRLLDFSDTGVTRTDNSKISAYSIRCLKD